nr:MAG TPA: hypothetical protein [Caudoviricetes sp.]
MYSLNYNQDLNSVFNETLDPITCKILFCIYSESSFPSSSTSLYH